MKSSVKNKTALIVIVSVVAFVIVAMLAIALGHNLYSARQEAEITDYGKLVTTSDGLIYQYADGIKSVDITDAFKVSAGADYSITTIKDEDGTVSRGSGKIIDLSEKEQRVATIEVVSASKKTVKDYLVTFLPQSCENNLISYDLSGGDIAGDLVLHYSGSYDIELPTPTKTYTSKASGNVYVYPFEGWYTTPDFEEGTKLSSIPKGSEGEISLYAKYAAPQIEGSRDGYQYILFGYYPQERVTDYSLVKTLRNSTEYEAVKGNSIGYFTYGGNRYCYFIPENLPNVSENGYSAGTTYFFYVQQVEWRVLKEKDQTASAGETVYLLSTAILNCGAYADDGGTVEDMYKKYVTGNNFDISGFERWFFDPDTLYCKGIRSVVDSIYTVMTSYSSLGGYNPQNVTVQPRTFKEFTGLLSSNYTNHDCYAWLLNYDEVLTASSGFSANYKDNDPLRKAYCTDFAAACGVYRSTSYAHKDQGSWWLRGVGTYEDKHIAYVKYTGYVHSYGAMRYTVRSGVRPSMKVAFPSP